MEHTLPDVITTGIGALVFERGAKVIRDLKDKREAEIRDFLAKRAQESVKQ